MIARLAAKFLAAAAVCVSLDGCIVLPTPPFYISEREDVGSEVPAFIVAGTTSRADVLFALGQPDRFDVDDEFSYVVVRNSAGAYMIAMGQEYHYASAEFRELHVTFDRHGIVQTATIETGRCIAEEQADLVTCGSISLP